MQAEISDEEFDKLANDNYSSCKSLWNKDGEWNDLNEYIPPNYIL
ncbi:MAG: hypothetical protein ACTSQU_03665 [Promethearchaeota archaeon]